MSFPSKLVMSKGWKGLINSDNKVEIIPNKIHWSSCGPPNPEDVQVGRAQIDFLEPNRAVLRRNDKLVAYLFIKNRQIHGQAMFPANPYHPLPIPWKLGY